jgi:hypothetical protein
MIKKLKSLGILEVIGLLFALYVIVNFAIFSVNAFLHGWNNPF